MASKKQPREPNPFLSAIAGRNTELHSVDGQYNTSSEYGKQEDVPNEDKRSGAHSNYGDDNAHGMSNRHSAYGVYSADRTGIQERFNMRIDGGLLDDIKTLAKARATDATKLIIEVMGREVAENRELIESFRKLVAKSKK